MCAYPPDTRRIADSSSKCRQLFIRTDKTRLKARFLFKRSVNVPKPSITFDWGNNNGSGLTPLKRTLNALLIGTPFST